MQVAKIILSGTYEYLFKKVPCVYVYSYRYYY